MTTSKLTPENFKIPDFSHLPCAALIQARSDDIDRQWAATPHTPGNEAETNRVVGLAVDLHNDIEWLLRKLPVKFDIIDPMSLNYAGTPSPDAARSAACRIAKRCETLAEGTYIAEAYTLAARLNKALHAVINRDFEALRELNREVTK